MVKNLACMCFNNITNTAFELHLVLKHVKSLKHYIFKNLVLKTKNKMQNNNQHNAHIFFF